MAFKKGQSGNKNEHCFTIDSNVKASAGIYQIEMPSGKKYIGSASNMIMRGYSHRSKLKNKKHCNIHLQRSYDKHGLATMKPLFYCAEVDLQELEQACLDKFKPELNILTKAYRSIGYKHTKESRKIMSDCSIRRKDDTNWLKKVSVTWFKKGSKKIHGSQKIEDIAHLGHEKTKKAVIVENVSSGETKTFKSVLEASIFVGGPNRSCVSHRLSGRLINEYKGYRFSYAIR